jgi:hypothetical protein
VGPHDDRDPILNVYAELYRLVGVQSPENAGRDKPPCCEKGEDLPPLLGVAVTEMVGRAESIRKTRQR